MVLTIEGSSWALVSVLDFPPLPVNVLLAKVSRPNHFISIFFVTVPGVAFELWFLCRFCLPSRCPCRV